ncbi:MAG: rod shape-determining protein MreC [Synergistota bacterium]|nr:rod shape-determining protein MreC [Synergistota bacterium]
MTENRQGYVISGLCAVALGLVLTLGTGSPFTEKAMGFWTDCLVWLEQPATHLRGLYWTGRKWVLERRFLIDKMSKMEEENDALFLSLHLKDALDLRDSLLKSTVNAMVDLRLPLSWWEEIRINQGGMDGISPGDPVLQKGFFIGRVNRVDGNKSWITLLASTEEMIPVVIRETRDVGVVVGDGMGGIWLCYIPLDSEIKAGMNLDTALISEIIPPGIPVGTVTDDIRENEQGYREYRISSGADLSRLYDVKVFRRGDRLP